MGLADKSFPKSEKLTGKKKIEELFKRGSSFYLYPFRVYHCPDASVSSTQVLISVPKKKFKRAVDRNLLKRRIREAYRLNKVRLGKVDHSHFLGFIYLSNEILPFGQIQDQLIQCIQRLNRNDEATDEKKN